MGARSSSGGASGTAAALELLGILKPVKRAAEVVSFVAGPPLATYTGALLANTAVPVWHEARRELPLLFGASAMATRRRGDGALRRPGARPGPRAGSRSAPRRASVAVTTATMRRRLGFVGEVYDQRRRPAATGGSRALCSGAGAALLALARPAEPRGRGRGRRARPRRRARAPLVRLPRPASQSARDPKYTIVPQRERLERRSA